MEQYIGKTCPFCKTDFTETDEVVVCDACDMPHHKTCWDENKGCSTFGCKNQNSVADEKRCEKCEAVLTDGQAFCPECGNQCTSAQPDLLCQACSTPIEPGQQFCPKCGLKLAVAPNEAPPTAVDAYNTELDEKNQKKSKNKIIIGAIAGIVIVLGIIGYFVASHMNQEKLQAEFMSDANGFSSTSISAAANLEVVGNAIKNNWYDYIYNNGTYYKKYSSIDDAVLKAQIAKTSEIDKAKTQKDELDKLYNKLRRPPSDKPELKDISDAVSKLYDEYEILYDCVISPTGNYSAFTSAFSAADTATVNAYKKLKNLLE